MIQRNGPTRFLSVVVAVALSLSFSVPSFASAESAAETLSSDQSAGLDPSAFPAASSDQVTADEDEGGKSSEEGVSEVVDPAAVDSDGETALSSDDALAAEDGGSPDAAAPASVEPSRASLMSAQVSASTVAELKAQMEGATEATTITLEDGFAASLVSDGTASVNITHDYPLTIVASPSLGTLDAPASGPHFYIDNSGTGMVTFEGISFQSTGSSGGVQVVGGQMSFVDSCSFVGSGTNTAIAVLTRGADLTIEDVTFQGNAVSVNMGNDTISAGKILSIARSSFADSTGIAVQGYRAGLNLVDSQFTDGGDTAVNGGIAAVIDNCLFKNNVGQNRPGALQPSSASASGSADFQITRSSFIENTRANGSSQGGGALSLPSGSSTAQASVSIENSYFQGNHIDYDGQGAQGGAIYGGTTWNYADLTITDSVFEGNQANGVGSNADGGAIGIRNNGGTGASVTISGCNFFDNYAGDDGGALLLEGGQSVNRLDAYIVNCTFNNNSCYGRAGSSSFASGSGGAIQFYGMTDSEITHCTFYANSVTNPSMFLGGGGAVALDTNTAAPLASRPVLSNNIFIANTTASAILQGRGNIYVTSNSDAGVSKNNGNVGYDNGASGYSQGQNVSAGIITENVFAEKNPDGTPVAISFGQYMGADGESFQRYYYLVSPLTDEMYRDGSGPYYVENVREDVRGYPRDHYPNAGAVEIYWTKFDPDVASGGYWVSPPPSGIQSLDNPNVYYLVTDPPDDNYLVTFPRSSFDTLATNVGFEGWESDHDDPHGSGIYPIVQPSVMVESTKQTYTAKWNPFLYRVDFDLQHDGLWGVPLINVPTDSLIAPLSPAPTREGYAFGGWYKDAECTLAWDFATDTVTTDTVLYALWSEKPIDPVDPVDPVGPDGPGNGGGTGTAGNQFVSSSAGADSLVKVGDGLPLLAVASIVVLSGITALGAARCRRRFSLKLRR